MTVLFFTGCQGLKCLFKIALRYEEETGKSCLEIDQTTPGLWFPVLCFWELVVQSKSTCLIGLFTEWGNDRHIHTKFSHLSDHTSNDGGHRVLYNISFLFTCSGLVLKQYSLHQTCHFEIWMLITSYNTSVLSVFVLFRTHEFCLVLDK